MAKALDIERPYINLKTYLKYKQRGADTLRKFAKEISALSGDVKEGEEE